MISTLLIHPDILKRIGEAEKILTQLSLSQNHPNVLWFGEEEKLGISESRQIKEFLSLKPYQDKNQAVVLISAENLTLDAQNALLKTLEEPLDHVSIILGAHSEDALLSTIVSRCQLIHLKNSQTSNISTDHKYQKEIEKLISSSYEERFLFVEKLDDKAKFLSELIQYFRHKLIQESLGGKLNPPPRWIASFLKNLMEAEKWAHQNVNIRAILEYLMLKMPQVGDQR